MHVNAIGLTGIDFTHFSLILVINSIVICLICQSSLFSVNSAFNTLRLLIPTEPKNRKLSKIETLRLAKSYISHLSASLVIGERENFLLNIHAKMIYCPIQSEFFMSTAVLRSIEKVRRGQQAHRLPLKHLHFLCFVGNSSKAD